MPVGYLVNVKREVWGFKIMQCSAMINGDNVKQSIEVVVGEVDQLIGSARAGVGACMIFLRNMWPNSIHEETKSLLVLTFHTQSLSIYGN